MIEAAAGKQYCSFTVGELLLGIEVERVREILTDQQVTPVPLATSSVLGLLNVRGELMTVVDARRRLGLNERARGEPVAHVIVLTGGEALSLVVDAENEVVDVEPATAQNVPETVRSEVRTLLSEIYELADGTLLLALDPDRALSLIAT
jgi:purine-binding chemotaxis protein CheW